MKNLKVKLSLLALAGGFILSCGQVRAAENTVTLSNVKISSPLHLDDRKLQNSLKGYFGLPVTAELLQQILNEITRYCRSQGFTASTAYLPEQTSVNGQILVRVIQPQVDTVEIENGSRLKPKALRRLLGDNYTVRLRSMKLDDIQEVFLKFGDLNAVKTSGFYERRDGSDSLKLMVGLEDPKYLNFEVFADNHGTKAAGRWRSGFSVQSTNLSGNADKASLFYARTNEKQNNFSINYALPVNSYFTYLGASLCYQDYELSGKYRVLGAQGKSLTSELFLRQPLSRTLQSKLDLTAGLRYKNITDEFRTFDLSFKKHTVQGYLGLNGFWKDEHFSLAGGVSGAYGKLVYEDDFLAQENHSFRVFNADASIYVPVGQGTTVVNTLQLQYSPDSLESSDTFQATGPLGVAAYSSNALNGDSGLVESLGLRFKPFDNLDLTITPHLDFGVARYKDYSKDSLWGSGVILQFFYKGAFVKAQSEYALSKPQSDEDRVRLLLKFGYQYV